MLRRTSLALLAALAALPALAEPAVAPDAPPGPAADLVQAHHAYAKALSQGEVALLITAIRLARGITLRPATGWELTTTSDALPDAPEGMSAVPDPGGETALTIARNLAGEDPDLQDLVYDLDAQLPGAPVQTVVFAPGRLAPGQTDVWRLPLFGAVPAELAVIGDGDAPLSFDLADSAGLSLCTHPPTALPQLCRITPARNAFFTVTVVNSGTMVVTYQLVSN